MMTEEQKESFVELSNKVMNELLPILTVLHRPRMTFEECRERVKEDMATICLLIVQGHLILKHKEGGLDGIFGTFQTKNSQEDSSASGKKPEDER